jgi:hypothetical protein
MSSLAGIYWPVDYCLGSAVTGGCILEAGEAVHQAANEREYIEALREREQRGEPLDAAEQAQLTAFYQRLEPAEASYLAPATERLHQQVRAQKERIQRLVTLREEKRFRLARIQSLVREMQALEAEENQLLAAKA